MELFNLKVLLPKEEMQNNNDELKNKDNKSSPDLKHGLVLSIDPAEKIIKFNKECEKILGFQKKEIINKKFFDTLIPNKYLKKWKNTVKLIRKNKSKDDFKLPLLAKNSEEIMILWSCFPVKDTKGIVKDIGFVGKLVPSKIDEKDQPAKLSKPEMKKTEKNIMDDKIIKELVEKNLELENKNKQLEEELETIENKLAEDDKSEEEPELDTEIPSGKFERSFSGLISGKKKRAESQKMIDDLEQKRIQLEERENQIINEKRGINEKINEFCKWREKLELLENELYKREEELKQKEELLYKGINAEPIGATSPTTPTVVTTKDVIENSDFLDKITDSAVVLKRGILKQINDPFVSLLGYKNEEIIEKSIFNFIAPEGFQSAETYYFSRIKGENISTYETVFLTKENSKIDVEISYRPTTFNGEKAEIAIIKKINREKENIKENPNDNSNEIINQDNKEDNKEDSTQDNNETTNQNNKDTTDETIEETTNENIKENINDNSNEIIKEDSNETTNENNKENKNENNK
ncbi:hypothetical protein AYK24_01940 [Thermoplasmatales archaeon SG8-52-4]|nr:MAG: hypothetical protein AYK24_01940 [Thermoplasmatales archaeon SG8-52-4]